MPLGWTCSKCGTGNLWGNKTSDVSLETTARFLDWKPLDGMRCPLPGTIVWSQGRNSSPGPPHKGEICRSEPSVHSNAAKLLWPLLFNWPIFQSYSQVWTLQFWILQFRPVPRSKLFTTVVANGSQLPTHPGKSWIFSGFSGPWKVLESQFSPGKSWKWKLKVLESTLKWRSWTVDEFTGGSK